MDTLASLFPLDPEPLKRLLIDQQLARHPWLRECGPAVIADVAAVMVQRLPEALDSRLDALLLEAFLRQPPAWAAAAESGSEGGAAAASAEIPLPPQRLNSRHRPALQLQVGDRPLLEVVFDASLELRLEGMRLRLVAGHPQAVTIERAQGSGILMLGRQMLARFQEQPLTLPPWLSLEPPAGPDPPSARIGAAVPRHGP
jgi:hypothetical protein